MTRDPHLRRFPVRHFWLYGASQEEREEITRRHEEHEDKRIAKYIAGVVAEYLAAAPVPK